MSDLFHPDVPADFIEAVFKVMEECPQHTFQVLTKRAQRLAEMAPTLPWPANIWMGVSVESDRYSWRVRSLADVPAAVRFASVEPLLGPVPTLDLDVLDWLIVGGESGRGHRPIDAEWVRDVRDRCVAASVPFFFKQWGGRTPKAGGRSLDGRTWDEKPRSASAGLAQAVAPIA
jgi:protein gp37